jgi:peptidoglycan/LPS O-acetylase OafA/YrhL
MVCLAFTLMPAGSTAAAFVLFLALTLLAAIAFERLVDRPAIAISRRVGIVPLVSPREMTQK